VPFGVAIIGANTVAATLEDLAEGLGAMSDAAGAAARIALAASRSRAPVDSGRLRGSGRAGSTGSTAQVVFSVPYAGPIHWGWRARNITPSLFAVKGVDSTEARWTDVYRDAVQGLCDGVDGA
jgi:hypothetical protein